MCETLENVGDWNEKLSLSLSQYTLVEGEQNEKLSLSLSLLSTLHTLCIQCKLSSPSLAGREALHSQQCVAW